MKLKELDPHEFKENGQLIGLAFLCPCCKKEYMTVFFRPTPYQEQRRLMKDIVNTEEASWIPAPAFDFHSATNEDDLNRITIRPSIDAAEIGHAAGFISGGIWENR